MTSPYQSTTPSATDEIVIRPVREDEQLERSFVTGYAFAGDRGERGAEEFRRAMSLDWTRGVFDRGRLIASLIVMPYTICFEGRETQMVGIGDVACLPERRRQGHVGRLLRAALAEMHDNGVPLSGLWTPHVPLYRRYGWEVATHLLEMRVPIKRARLRDGGPVAGHAERVTADDWQRLDAMYSAAVAGGNSGLRRYEARWRYGKFQAGNNRQMDAAIWIDADGKDRGYTLYRETGWESYERGNLRVSEVVGLDGDAYRGLTAYLLQHDLSADAIWWAAEEEPLLALLDDPSIVTQTRRYALLLRLVDLPAAFAARPCYAGVPASCVIAVRDRSCPWNDGVWRLDGEAGRLAAQRTQAEAALSLDVSTLGALFNGGLSPVVAAQAGLIAVQDQRALPLLRDLLVMRTRPNCSEEF